MTPADRPFVLLTGAAGRIGAAVRRELGERFRFRLADLATVGLAETPGGGHEIVRLDVRDAAAVAAACVGVEAVLHLAADPSPAAEWESSLLPVNVNGTLNALRGARAAGCRRFVFASSAHAVAGYPPGAAIPADAPPRPVNLYGVSKAFGEAACACFAAQGLPSIAVRIGAYEAPWLRENPDPAEARAYVSPRDLNDLFARCLAAEGVDYAVVAGVSDNRPNRFDLRATRALLGYAPRDDGCRVLGVAPPD